MATFLSELPQRIQQVLASAAGPSIEKPDPVPAAQLARMIDHTQLKPEATPEMIDNLCVEAREHGFASVCVNPCNIARCAAALEGTDVLVCSVVAFPLGATPTDVKLFEAERVIRDGAREVDMVINVGALKAGDHALVLSEIRRMAERCHVLGAHLKVIIEAALLTQEEKVAACLLIKEAGADFAKTSTGFGPGGATIEDVALMRAAVGPDLGVKAAGGIRSYETAIAMVAAGATRLGASAGISIISGAKS